MFGVPERNVHGIFHPCINSLISCCVSLQVDTPDVVVGVLLEGLSDKKPKVPPACVGILTKALQLFGARSMPLKDIKTALPGTAKYCTPIRKYRPATLVC